jgi:hypothetical protein
MTSPVFVDVEAGLTERALTEFFTTSTEASPVTPSPAARTSVFPGLMA